jgi:hypothetical protein
MPPLSPPSPSPAALRRICAPPAAPPATWALFAAWSSHCKLLARTATAAVSAWRATALVFGADGGTLSHSSMLCRLHHVLYPVPPTAPCVLHLPLLGGCISRAVVSLASLRLSPLTHTRTPAVTTLLQPPHSRSHHTPAAITRPQSSHSCLIPGGTAGPWTREQRGRGEGKAPAVPDAANNKRGGGREVALQMRKKGLHLLICSS